MQRFLVLGVSMCLGVAVSLVIHPVLPLNGAPKPAAHPALIPFEPVTVNLNETRLTRYLRVKLMLVIKDEEKASAELVAKKKAFLKNWLITYLADRSLKELQGRNSLNRLRREINEKFNEILFPDGSEKVDDVLFDEFLVQ